MIGSGRINQPLSDDLGFLKSLREETPKVTITSRRENKYVEISICAWEKVDGLSPSLFSALDLFGFCYRKTIEFLLSLRQKYQLGHRQVEEWRKLFRVSISFFLKCYVRINGKEEGVKKAFYRILFHL